MLYFLVFGTLQVYYQPLDHKNDLEIKEINFVEPVRSSLLDFFAHFFSNFRYESIKKSDGGKRLALAGYASVVRFYNYPDMIRPRIAQILLLPQYRGSGNGVKFLQAIYSDFIKMKNVRDITGTSHGICFVNEQRIF